MEEDAEHNGADRQDHVFENDGHIAQLGVRGDVADHASERQPAELYGENRDQQDADHPGGDGRDRRQKGNHAVVPFAIVARQKQRQRDAEDEDNQVSGSRQQHGVGHIFQQDFVQVEGAACAPNRTQVGSACLQPAPIKAQGVQGPFEVAGKVRQVDTAFLKQFLGHRL